MTPERAKEILQLSQFSGLIAKHMTEDEIDLVYDIWGRMEGSSSIQEVLKLIAARMIK